jgi:hypothetical protein
VPFHASVAMGHGDGMRLVEQFQSLIGVTRLAAFGEHPGPPRAPSGRRRAWRPSARSWRQIGRMRRPLPRSGQGQWPAGNPARRPDPRVRRAASAPPYPWLGAIPPSLGPRDLGPTLTPGNLVSPNDDPGAGEANDTGLANHPYRTIPREPNASLATSSTLTRAATSTKGDSEPSSSRVTM